MARFQAGQSGNPAGRPRGSRHKTTMLLERLAQQDARALLAAVVQSALTGDMASARWLLDKVMPPQRDRAIEVDLPPLRDAADVVEASRHVVEAVACGTLTPAEGQGFLVLLGGLRQAIETSELAARLDALEAAHGHSP